MEFHPNIIHPSTPRSALWSLSLRFPHQDPIHPPPLEVEIRLMICEVEGKVVEDQDCAQLDIWG